MDTSLDAYNLAVYIYLAVYIIIFFVFEWMAIYIADSRDIGDIAMHILMGAAIGLAAGMIWPILLLVLIIAGLIQYYREGEVYW